MCFIIIIIMIIEMMHRGKTMAANIPQNTFVRRLRISLSSSSVSPLIPCFAFMRFVRITNGDIMIANGHNTIPTMNSKNGGTSIESNPKESTIIQKVSITQLVSTNIIKKSIQSNNPGGILRPRRGLKLIPCVEDVVVQFFFRRSLSLSPVCQRSPYSSPLSLDFSSMNLLGILISHS